jgi:hypothetical protein
MSDAITNHLRFPLILRPRTMAAVAGRFVSVLFLDRFAYDSVISESKQERAET